MSTQTETTAAVTASRTGRPPMKPGIYRGQSPAEFGLYRLRADGVWLFCSPVLGSTWKIAFDQSGDKLTPLVDETNH